MRSTKNQTEFFKKMKKKPALQAIIDNIDNYTEAELEQVNQPKWIKEELKRLKANNGEFVDVHYIVQKMIENSEEQEDPLYNVYQYYGETKFVHDVEIISGEVLAERNGIVFLAGREFDLSSIDSLQCIASDVTYTEYTGIKGDLHWKRVFPGEQRIEEKTSGPDKNGWEGQGDFKIRRIQ